MSLDLGGNKQKHKDKSKYAIVEIDLFRPSKKKYPHFDFETDIKKQLQNDDSSGEDERFHDREALEMVRRLEEKYGSKKTKKGKKVRIGREDDYIDKAAGYDLEDDFIDDSEAYDELIPSTMDTAKGGFYVNKGQLEFKSKHGSDDEDSDVSDVSSPVKEKPKKRVLVESDDEPTTSTAVPASVDAKKDGDRDKPKLAKSASGSSEVSRPRLAGMPPTKRFASAHQASPVQKAAEKIKKKRLAGAGAPPTLAKRKPQPSQSSADEGDELMEIMDDIGVSGLGLDKEKEVQDMLKSVNGGGATTSAESSEDKSSSSSSSDSSREPTPTPGGEEDKERQSAVGTAPTARPPASPRKGLPPLTDTLTGMLDKFREKTANLAPPGQKRRLQREHVQLAMQIEEQAVKDGHSSHEKSRILDSLATMTGIQKQSLLARMKSAKEHGMGGGGEDREKEAGKAPVPVPVPVPVAVRASAAGAPPTKKPLTAAAATASLKAAAGKGVVKPAAPSAPPVLQKAVAAPAATPVKAVGLTAEQLALVEEAQRRLVAMKHDTITPEKINQIVNNVKQNPAQFAQFIATMNTVIGNPPLVLKPKQTAAPVSNGSTSAAKPAVAAATVKQRSSSASSSAAAVKPAAAVAAKPAQPAASTPTKAVSQQDRVVEIQAQIDKFKKSLNNTFTLSEEDYKAAVLKMAQLRSLGQPTTEPVLKMKWSEGARKQLQQLADFIYMCASSGLGAGLDKESVLVQCLQTVVQACAKEYCTIRALVEEVVRLTPSRAPLLSCKVYLELANKERSKAAAVKSANRVSASPAGGKPAPSAPSAVKKTSTQSAQVIDISSDDSQNTPP